LFWRIIKLNKKNIILRVNIYTEREISTKGRRKKEKKKEERRKRGSDIPLWGE